MKKVKVIEGVAAELNGKFWGRKYKDEGYFFGDYEDAKIEDPQLCHKTTDMTNSPRDGRQYSDYGQLKIAKLVKVKKTITIEFEVIED